jgi:NAD-dependent deacetylase
MADIQLQMKTRNEKIPACATCGHFLLPDTVQFGKPLDHHALVTAQEAAADCDLFICIGSSLLVQPANLIPAIAINMNIPLVILNKTYVY